MVNKKNCVLTLMFSAFLTTVCQGQITRIRYERVDNSSGGAELDGYVTTDILIDFDGQYTGSQMLIEFDPGHLYFNGFGAGFGPQSAAFRPLVPALEWHSMVALGSDSSSISNADATTGPWGNPNINGNAVDLGSIAASESFGPSLIDIAWGPGGTNPVLDQNGFLVARLTLSNDADGWGYFLASANGEITVVGICFENGRICPEPSSLALLGIGVVGTLGMRRRK